MLQATRARSQDLICQRMGTQSPEVVIIRAHGADFQVGGLMRMCKHEQTGGVWGHAPSGKFQI